MPVTFGLLLNLVGVMGEGATREQVWAYLANYVADATPARYPELDRLIAHALAYHRDVIAPTLSRRAPEGVEIDALEGARSLMAADALFVCEEHGNDPNHTVSRHLLGSTPLAVHAFDPTAGRFVAVNDPSVLDGIKRHPWVGYNVFATASPMWRDALDRINGRSA